MIKIIDRLTTILLFISLVITGSVAYYTLNRPVKSNNQNKKTVERTYEAFSIEKAPECTPEGVKYFYYGRLDGNYKRVYDQIYTSMIKRKPVMISNTSTDTITTVVNAVLFDHPEIFYVEANGIFPSIKSFHPNDIWYSATYSYSKEESEMMMAGMNTEVERILADLDSSASDYEKIRYVSNAICNETWYSSSAPDNQNINSVFLNHSTVCAGYSKASQFLLNKLGVECTTITGDTANGGRHGWNLVRSDGEWYYLDITWDDIEVSYKQSDDKLVRMKNYDYFMITTKDMEKTRTPDKIVELPNCTATKDNYFIHEGLYFTDLNKDQLNNAFEKAYNSGEDTMIIKCSNDQVFNEMVSYLLDQNNVIDYMLSNGGKGMFSRENANTLTLELYI